MQPTYLNFTPAKNDGTTAYRLVVKDVPVDAWSVDQRLQRQRLLRAEQGKRLLGEQLHREEERG